MAVWTARVPMFYLETVEHHAVDRVMRQFGHPQHIPDFPDWAPDHYTRDDRMRLDQAFQAYLDDCMDRWRFRSIRGVVVHPDARLDVYMDWYLRHGRLLIGNPALHDVGAVGYVPMAATVESLIRGLRRLHQQGLDWMTQPGYAHCGETVARDVLHILHEARQGGAVQGPTVPAAQYQQPAMVHGRGRGRGRGRARGDARGGARRGGRGRARVGGIFIHDIPGPIPEDEPAAEDAHTPDIDPAAEHAPSPAHDPAASPFVVRAPSFDPSPSTPACFPMSENVDLALSLETFEWDYMRVQLSGDPPARDLAGGTRLSFGSAFDAGDVPVIFQITFTFKFTPC